jgi:hypothetical protein
MDRARRALVGCAAVLLVVGCSGSKSAPPTTTTTPPTSTTPSTVAPIDTSSANAYFTALSTQDQGSAAASSEPGSDAALFAQHQLDARRLAGDSEQGLVTKSTPGQAYEVCRQGGSCVQYDQLVIDPATGLLRSFSTSGSPLTGRVVGAGATASANGLDIREISAYRSTSDQVTVIIEITNASDATLRVFGFTAVYLPDGGTSAIGVDGAWGDDSIAPGASGRLLLSFPGASLGGRISLSGLRSDDLDVTLDAELPAP